MAPDRLRQLLDRIDHLNAADPHCDIVDGVAHPRELLYAKRLADWVLRLNPQASEPLRIAARGQHVQRWTIPRDRYPMTRAGYLKWRETLKAFHAKTVGELMAQVGYASAEIDRVRTLIRKKQLATDPDTQTLEDALCLVFLETQFDDLKRKTPDDKMREVVRKTWAKMSQNARELAMQLPLSQTQRAFLLEALS